MSGPDYGTEFIVAKLRRSLRVENGEASMSFNSINGRHFRLNVEGNNRYFGFELIPNGRLAHLGLNGQCDFTGWEGHEAALNDPNGYMEAIVADGLSPDDVVLVGSGYGVYSRCFSSVDEAAEEFARCLRDNERYDDIDRAKMADPAFNEYLSKEEERDSVGYWSAQTVVHQYSMENEAALFKGLYGIMGPLSDGAKKRLLSFFNAPSADTWDDCARLMIKGSKTMWQLWCEVDPNAPRTVDEEWPSIPDVDLMRNAIRQVGDVAPDPSEPSRRF